MDTYTLTLTADQHLELLSALVEVDRHIVVTTDGDEPANYAMDKVSETLRFERVTS